MEGGGGGRTRRDRRQPSVLELSLRKDCGWWRDEGPVESGRETQKS